ncbi:protein of unknown function [Kingella kingae]|nr:protein of unknown function [Kingella kingae]
MADDKVRYMPKRGQQMDYNKMDVRAAVLNKVELAKLLKPRIEADGGNWQNAMSRLQQLYPDGALESELESVFERIRREPLKLRTGTHG